MTSATYKRTIPTIDWLLKLFLTALKGPHNGYKGNVPEPPTSSLAREKLWWIISHSQLLHGLLSIVLTFFVIPSSFTFVYQKEDNKTQASCMRAPQFSEDTASSNNFFRLEGKHLLRTASRQVLKIICLNEEHDSASYVKFCRGHSILWSLQFTVTTEDIFNLIANTHVCELSMRIKREHLFIAVMQTRHTCSP